MTEEMDSKTEPL